MKRRLILILTIVVILGLIVGGIWYYVRQNADWRMLARVKVAMNARRFDRAVELAERYIQKRPGNWEGYYYQGRAYMGQAKYEEARTPLERALEIKPSAAEVAILLSQTRSLPAGRISAASRDIDRQAEAVEGFKKANEVLAAWKRAATRGEGSVSQEDRLDILQEEGMNWLRLGAAESRRAELLEKEAGIAVAADNAQEAVLKRDRADTARKEAAKAESQAVELLKQVVDADGTRDQAAQIIVQLCIRRGDVKTLTQLREAIESLDLKDRPPVAAMMLVMQELKKSEEEPFSESAAKSRSQAVQLLDGLMENVPEEDPARILLLLARAEVALLQRQPGEALEICDRILKDNPRQGKARLYRAQALMAQGHLADAERELFALKTDFPLWEHAQFAYAKAAAMSGYPELGREALRTIVKDLNPRHGRALRLLATYLLVREFYDQAFVDAQAYYRAHPEEPEAVRLLVATAKHTDQPVLARDVLEKASGDYPDRPGMLLAVADGWSLLGERGKARDAIHQAADLKPTTIVELQAVVLALIRDGRAPEAERTLYDQKAKNPKHPVIRFLLGRLFEATGRRLQAVEEYGKAAALDPGNETYKVGEASALYAIGNLAKAGDVLEQVHLPSEKAERLRRMIRLREAGSAGELRRAEAEGLDAAQYYLGVGQPQRCVEICLAELKKSGDQPNTEVHRLLGQAYLIQGRPDQCLKEWFQVVKLKPLLPFAYRSIASVMIRGETPDRVEAALRGIPEANDILVDLTMGWLHDRRRDFETALGYYRRVADRENLPEDTRNRARVLWAQSLANGGKTDEAIATLGAITGPPVWQRQALWNKAEVLVAAGRLADAEGILTRLCSEALQAEDTSLLRGVARLYGRMKRGDKATEVCDEMLKLLPNHAWPYLLKAAVLVRAGKLDEAVEWYRNAIERQPGNLESYLTLARIIDLRQNSPQALEVLTQLESRGEAGRAAALSERGDMLARWGLPAQAVECYEELSRLGYGEAPRIKLVLGRAFARLGRKERARRTLEGIPKYSRGEYVRARQLLAELANTAEKKLEILDKLNAQYPGRVSVLLQRLRILFGDGRHGEVVQTYESYINEYGEQEVVPPEASFIALRSYLDETDFEAVLKLSERIAKRSPKSHWPRIAVLLLLPKDPGKAAKMLPTVSEAGVFDALLGLMAARGAGEDTEPWAERIRAVDRELTEGQPSRSIPSSYKILAAVVNGATGQAEAELAQFTSASTVGRNVAGEMVAFAKSNANGAASEAVKLLQASIALEMGLPVFGWKKALDVLSERPESQWAAAVVVQGTTDPAIRRKVLGILRPKDCVMAKILQAALAADERDFTRTAEIYRSLAEVEKENVEVLRRLASAETVAGNLEEALVLQRRIWEMSRSSVAANNAAYLTAHLWSQNQEKLKEAQDLVESAIEQEPQVPAFVETLGWISHLREDDAQALSLLRRAVKGLPGSIEAHAHLGVVEAGAGNTELARWHLTAATSIAARLKTEGPELTAEQLQALKIAEKGLSDLGAR